MILCVKYHTICESKQYLNEWGEEEKKTYTQTKTKQNDASNDESRLPWTHNFIGFNNENKWFGSDVLKKHCANERNFIRNINNPIKYTTMTRRNSIEMDVYDAEEEGNLKSFLV